jgi:hypothetical protein
MGSPWRPSGGISNLGHALFDGSSGDATPEERAHCEDAGDSLGCSNALWGKDALARGMLRRASRGDGLPTHSRNFASFQAFRTTF